MTTGEMVTAIIDYYVNQGGSDSTNADLRAKVAHHLYTIIKRIWAAYPWPFRLGAGTVMVTSGVGNMPTDFTSAGPAMVVTKQGTTHELRYRHPQDLFRSLAIDTGTSDLPTHYTIANQTTLGLPRLYVYRANGSAITLALKNYQKKAPVPVDRPAAPTVAEGSAGNVSGTNLMWKITFVTADGETEAGVASGTLSPSSKQVNLTAIPVATGAAARVVTSRKVYRLDTSTGTYKLVGTIADNVTTTYTDNVLAASLGAEAPALTAAITGLEQLPSDWHETLIFDWLRARVMSAQGDLRDAGTDAAGVRELRSLWADWRPEVAGVVKIARYGVPRYR